MKTNRGVVIGSVVLAIIAAGFFFGQQMSAVEKPSVQEIAGDTQQTIGTVVAEVEPIVQAMPIGIKNTINIPPAAFVPNGSGGSYYFNENACYLMGGSGNPVLNAAVIFPKGAKKILHVDFYVTDGVGNSSRFRMFDVHTAVSGAAALLIDFYSTIHTGLTKYSVTPANNKIYSDHVYYISLMINGNGYFSGAIVYYSTVL